MIKNTKPKGYTLIELLVVITIVGILAIGAVTIFQNVREKARDSKRLEDIRNMETAMKVYNTDNGTYPNRNKANGPTTAHSCPEGGNSNYCGLAMDLEGNYISYLPRDPLGIDQSVHRYYYDSDTGNNNQDYGLMIRFEHSGNFSLVDDDGGYYGGGGTYYEIGIQPAYCMKTYTGSERNWWGSSCGNPATDVCCGGN